MRGAALALALSAALLGACGGHGVIDVSQPPPPARWETPEPARAVEAGRAERVEAGATAEIVGTEEVGP